MDQQRTLAEKHTGLFWLFIAIIAFSYISLTITLTSGVYIVSELGGEKQIAVYGFSFFGVCNAIGISFGKVLTSKVRSSSILLTALIACALLSLLSALCSNFLFFLITRCLAGFCCGNFFWSAVNIENNFFKKTEFHIFNVVSAYLFIIGASFSVCVSGWIAYDYSWRYLFIAEAFIAVVLALLVWMELKVIPEEKLALSEEKTSVVSFIFYAIGIFSIAFVLITGQQFDWFRSPLLNTLLILGIPSFIFFIFHERATPYPLFSLKLLGHPVLMFGLICVFLFFSTYYTVITLLALWLSLFADYTPIWIGIIFGTTLSSGIGFVLLQNRFPQIDYRIYLLTALSLFCISCFYTTLFNVEVDLKHLMISRMMAGAGLSLFLGPIAKLCTSAHPQTEHVYSIQKFFLSARALGSALGPAVYQIIWQRREIFYHERMGELLTPYSMQTKQFFTDAKRFFLFGSHANAELDYVLEREAFSLALEDVFFLLGWLMVILFILLVLTLVYKARRESRRALSAETYQKAAPSPRGSDS